MVQMAQQEVEVMAGQGAIIGQPAEEAEEMAQLLVLVGPSSPRGAKEEMEDLAAAAAVVAVAGAVVTKDFLPVVAVAADMLVVVEVA